MKKTALLALIAFSIFNASAMAAQEVATVKDGATYSVTIAGRDSLTVTTKDNAYTIHIFETLPTSTIGKKRIRDISAKNNGNIMITFGKHDFAEFDPSTKKVEFLGAD